MATDFKIQSHLVKALAILTLLFTGFANAAEPVFSNKSGAIAGADPVAYFSLLPGEDAVLGSDEFTYEWKGATWKFSTEENLQKFVDSPESYAPQYGGYCAYAVAHGSAAKISPNSWKVVDDKLYLNYNASIAKKWVKEQSDFITRADAAWPEVLKK
jgi:YHS domain-containing protein